MIHLLALVWHKIITLSTSILIAPHLRFRHCYVSPGPSIAASSKSVLDKRLSILLKLELRILLEKLLKFHTLSILSGLCTPSNIFKAFWFLFSL